MRSSIAVLLVCVACATLAAQQAPAPDPVVAAEAEVTKNVSEYGSESLQAATARLRLGSELFRKGEPGKATVVLLAALPVLEQHQPEQDLAVADASLVLGAAAGLQGDLATAVVHYRRALAIRERTDPPGAPYLQLLRFNLSASLQAIGDFRAALELAERGEQQVSAMGGAEGLGAGNFHSVIALSLDGLGRNAEAYDRYLKAERILSKHRGRGDPDVLRLGGLAGAVLCRLGRAEAGLARLDAAVAALAQIPSARTFHDELHFAAVLLRVHYIADPQSYVAVRRELQRVLADPKVDPDGSSLVRLMAALAQADPSAIDLQAARAAVVRGEVQLGPGHVMLASMVANLGRMCATVGEVEEALGLLQRASAMFAAVPSDSGIDRFKVCWMLADLQCSLGQHEAASATVARGLAELPRLLEAWSSPLDERQRRDLIAGTRTAVDIGLIAAQRRDAPAAERWRLLLCWKGLVSRGLLQSLQWLRQHHDATTQELADRLRAAVGRSAAASRSGASAIAAEAAAEREVLERELARRLGAVPTALPDPAVVRAALAPDEVLLDWFVHGQLESFQHGQPVVGQRLLVFVVRRDHEPRLIDLGPLTEVVAATSAFLQLAARWTRPIDGADALVRAAGERLRDLLWTPLADAVPPNARVLLCPDSIVALVPFGCLPGRQPGSWLLEQHEFTWLGQAMEVSNQPLAHGAPGSLLAIGDVDYGRPQPSTGQRDGSREYAPLPASAAEIEAIGRLFAEVGDREPVLLRGRDATVARVAAAVPDARFLHVATHGWFTGSRELPASSVRIVNTQQRGKAESPFAVEPGFATGIALAGANTALGNDRDGVLTADEIALLDLQRCELAVLSACDTALGTVSAGDGLLGLRRALRLAGARRSVTAVWRVEDDATRRCMVAFYEALWRQGASPAAALRRAQLQQLERSRRETGQALVGTWGAFVLEGR